MDLHLPAFHQSVSPAGEHGQHGVRHRYLRIFPGDRRGDAGVLRRLRNRLVRGRLLGHRGQYPDLAAHHRKGLSGTAGRGLRPFGRAVPAGGPADSFRRVAAGGSVRRGVGALPAAAPDAGARVAPGPGHFQSLHADGPCLPGTEPAPVVIQSGRRPGAACGPTGRNALATGRPYRRMRRALTRVTRSHPARKSGFAARCRLASGSSARPRHPSNHLTPRAAGPPDRDDVSECSPAQRAQRPGGGAGRP